MKIKEMVKKGIISKDFFDGLKQGLKIAKNVALRQGFELSFPDIDEMEIEEQS